MICYDCKQDIEGEVVWLGEDYRSEKGGIEGPFPMHRKCSNQPWPLYELTSREAELWVEHGYDAFAIAWAERAVS